MTNRGRRFVTTVTVVTVVACLLASAASATTLVNGYTGQPITTGDLTRWLDHSKMPAPTGQILIYRNANMATACDGHQATACSDPGQIFIGGFSWHAQFLHELGHQWDFQHMAPNPLATTAPPLEPWQQEFENLWHLHAGWWDTLPHTDGGSPGEWFASAYQLCATIGPLLPHPLTLWEDDFNFPGYDHKWAMAGSCLLIDEANADPDIWETTP